MGRPFPTSGRLWSQSFKVAILADVNELPADCYPVTELTTTLRFTGFDNGHRIAKFGRKTSVCQQL